MQENLDTLYDKAFYEAQAAGSYKSARVILGFVDEILGEKLESVVDVGCGVGTWLKAWQDIKPTLKIAGVDGNSVDEGLYFIPKDAYLQVDLTADFGEILDAIEVRFLSKNAAILDKNAKNSAKTLAGGGG